MAPRRIGQLGSFKPGQVAGLSPGQVAGLSPGQVARSFISVNLRLKGPSPGRPGDGAQSFS